MRFLLAFLTFFSYHFLSAQEDVFYGTWAGRIPVDSTEVLVVMYITKGDTVPYQIQFDVPEQGFENLKLGKFHLQKDSIFIDVKKVRSKYTGRYDDTSGTMVGKWFQMGKEYPLVFEKTDKDYRMKRPQTPRLPYPYIEEEVSFMNTRDGILLSGTLTLPKGPGPFPAVVIINGSGQQERDCEIMGHKWALVLADYLTRQGIATLRYDDRGTGKSDGNPFTSTTFDFAEDAAAATLFLYKHDKIVRNKIGMIGHSEGGLIAQIIASRWKNSAFVVLMASPGIDITDLMVIQNRKMIEQENILREDQYGSFDKMTRSVFNTVLTIKNNEQAGKKIVNIYMDYAKTLDSVQVGKLNMTEKQVRVQLISLLSPWFRYFLSIKPKQYLTKIKCPVLAINGEKDAQVTANENLAAISDALKQARNSNVTLKKLNGLNHLFQNAQTGLPDEYARIEETISPDVLKLISDWINKQ